MELVVQRLLDVEDRLAELALDDVDLTVEQLESDIERAMDVGLLIVA